MVAFAVLRSVPSSRASLLADEAKGGSVCARVEQGPEHGALRAPVRLRPSPRSPLWPSQSREEECACGRARAASLPVAPSPRRGTVVRRDPAGPAYGRLDGAHPLLGHLDRVEAVACDVEGDPADLAERMANAGERFGMLLREELRAEISSASSSESTASTTPPGGTRPSAFARRNAVIIIATPDFMSSAPRPHTIPSAISAENGGCVHCWPAVGTTSTWP